MGCGASSESKYVSSTEDLKKTGSVDESQEYKQTIRFLSKVPLLKQLHPSDHPLLANACQSVSFAQGAKIMKQGDRGSALYVIKHGEAEVFEDSDSGTNVVAVLKGGDFCGETALFRDVDGTADIVAKSDVQALKIRRDKFMELGLNEKLKFPKRHAVGHGNNDGVVAVKEPSPKTSAERELIAQSLRNAKNLQAMVRMTDERIQAMIDIAWKEVIKAGQTVIKEGDMQADYFYVIQAGHFDVLQSSPQQKGRDSFVVNTVGQLDVGQSFGELALLYSTARRATIQATVDSVLWCFDRKNFKKILMDERNKDTKQIVAHLNQVALFDAMLADEKDAMAKAMVEMHFLKDDVIMRQGQHANSFFLLYQGEVTTTEDDAEGTPLTATDLKDAKPFGEKGLLQGGASTTTVIVTSETAKAFVLDRDSFQILLAPLENLIKRGPKGRTTCKKVRPSQLLDTTSAILKENLNVIGLLGCGGFGAVELVEDVTTPEPRQTYALKGLNKGFIVKRNMQLAVFNERDILLMTSSPFIVKLYETFNEGCFLYFLLQACLGGELHSTYWRKNLYGSEKHCKFYAAGVTLAFAHLHERHIIYRDLKPENLLLSEKGHLLVTDMGLAKCAIGKTFTTCGTPVYFAPELISSSGHTTALDWWTLGILIFELMAGDPPFEADYPAEIYARVQQGINKVYFPIKCKGHVESVIKELLKPRPEERLPVRTGGITNLQKHPWYRGFDWSAFEKGQMPGPHVPKVRSSTDRANFFVRESDKPKVFKYEDDGSGWDKTFATSEKAGLFTSERPER